MAKHQLIVSVSGIRGIVGDNLTPEVALRFALAYGTWVKGEPVVVSNDGRPSGGMLQRVVEVGLVSCGCLVVDLSVVPTPTVGYAVRHLGAKGGIQISASHNPVEYNGLKLFGPGGNVLAPQQGAEVLAIYESGDFQHQPWTKLGQTVPESHRAKEAHLHQIIDQIDANAIRQCNYSVLVDVNGGAGGELALKLLKEHLGCVCDVVGPDLGHYRHGLEPTEENLTTTSRQMQGVTPGYNVGFALDPDADRLAILDERGKYIGEELTLALAMEFRLQQTHGPVVVNMSTSRVTEDIAKKHGCAFHRSAVGEANVVARMREVGAVLGGEGNGGVIDPRVGWVRDPFIGMAMVLNLMAATGKSVSQLVAGLPHYVIVKDKYDVSRAGLPALYQRLKEHWTAAKTNEEDGLRLDWPDRWVHVRPSNTEPIVRVIAEALASKTPGSCAGTWG